MPTTPSPWKQILRQNFTQWDRLADYLELNIQQREQILKKTHFPLNLPLRLAQKIPKGTLNDPLLKQFLPVIEEKRVTKGFVLDPVGDENSRRSPKLLHKYAGRALLVTTSACAMHCRYCLRQNFDYEVQNKDFSSELQTLEEDTSIREVILSGGDPLSLSDDVLGMLLMRLGNMPHIDRIRFHTRFPIGIPERIDDGFLDILKKVRKQIHFVIHTNHPSELDNDIFLRLKTLQKIWCTILNQTVLLRDVNDNLETLRTLCELLVNNGILPYYLHQLDRVQGSAHFEVEEDQGRYLIHELTKVLPGYAVPKYVREIGGEPSKTSLY
jgi:EF-P beta-lysylation protein EpmB